MITRATMLAEVDDLLLRTECFRDAIALDRPERLATAEAVLKDTRRARELIAHSSMNWRARIEIVSLLRRVNVLVEAIGLPLQ